MKTTTVPAQVTTVEDRIAGNLSLPQMLLLIAPVLLTGLLFIVLPPLMSFAIYKFVIGGVSLIVCGILSLRFKSKLLFNWLLVVIRYNLRPQYFVFNKNDSYLRDNSDQTDLDDIDTVVQPVNRLPQRTSPKKLTLIDKDRLARLLEQRDTNLVFEVNRKGGLSVRLEQITTKN